LTKARGVQRIAAMRVLVVDDQIKIARALQKALVRAGAEVVIAADGDVGLRLALDESFDALVLDIVLPRRDGLEVLRELRSQHRTTPVLLLSARGGVSDRFHGLDLGADDYLPKPFELAEVVARVRALARRGVPLAATMLKVADLSIDLLRREARRGGAVWNSAPASYGSSSISCAHRGAPARAANSSSEYGAIAPATTLARTSSRLRSCGCAKKWMRHFRPSSSIPTTARVTPCA